MGEHEFGRDVPPRRACFRCRRVFAGWSRQAKGKRWGRRAVSKWTSFRPCSECGQQTVPISHAMKMPRRRDVRAWERLHRLFAGDAS